jgi:hypothetical protein
MADYKGIKGFKVTSIAGDPTNKVVGDVYYDTTANALKFVGAAAGVWASGTAMSTSRKNSGGSGTKTATLIWGTDGPAPVIAANAKKTELWNGTAWTEMNDLNNARYGLGSAGQVQSASFSAGGSKPSEPQAKCETWDGTNWTEIADLNTARYSLKGGAGTSSLGLIAGGGSPYTGATEEWNGTSWSELTALTVARGDPRVSGATTSAVICTGGYSDPATYNDICETWNGTSWTEENDMTYSAYSQGGSGTTASALRWAGQALPASVATTIKWNGTVWAADSDLGAATINVGCSSQSATAALSTGGTTDGTAVEEWTYADTNIKTVTVS